MQIQEKHTFTKHKFQAELQIRRVQFVSSMGGHEQDIYPQEPEL